jgi:hypothetical protein
MFSVFSQKAVGIRNTCAEKIDAFVKVLRLHNIFPSDFYINAQNFPIGHDRFLEEKKSEKYNKKAHITTEKSSSYEKRNAHENCKVCWRSI